MIVEVESKPKKGDYIYRGISDTLAAKVGPMRSAKKVSVVHQNRKKNVGGQEL